jgi:hypothetical protein
MSSSDNYTYYQQRAATERRHAQQAVDHSLARLHEQLAEAYEALVAEIEARPPLKLGGSQTIAPHAMRPDSSEQDSAATG